MSGQIKSGLGDVLLPSQMLCTGVFINLVEDRDRSGCILSQGSASEH